MPATIDHRRSAHLRLLSRREGHKHPIEVQVGGAHARARSLVSRTSRRSRGASPGKLIESTRDHEEQDGGRVCLRGPCRGCASLAAEVKALRRVAHSPSDVNHFTAYRWSPAKL